MYVYLKRSLWVYSSVCTVVCVWSGVYILEAYGCKEWCICELHLCTFVVCLHLHIAGIVMCLLFSFPKQSAGHKHLLW